MSNTIPSPTPPAAGTPSRVGGFEILEAIGQGGMGTVYRARQTSMDRVVALKILPPQFSADPQSIESFLREAKAAGRLQHSNIVAVLAAGQADGFCYYAMELVQGVTLQKLVQQNGALPENTALTIGMAVGQMLKFAWDKEQLIHRNVKPENVLFDSEGRVKLCDLGLARNFGESTLASLNAKTFGTPQYMSPEQAGAQTADFRTDIYSLGLTLYYAVTGRIPFQGGTPAEILARQINDQLPDPREIVPALSAHTCRLLEKMLAKSPGERYATWDDALRDLELARQGKPPQLPWVSTIKSSVRQDPRKPVSAAVAPVAPVVVPVIVPTAVPAAPAVVPVNVVKEPVAPVPVAAARPIMPIMPITIAAVAPRPVPAQPTVQTPMAQIPTVQTPTEQPPPAPAKRKTLYIAAGAAGAVLCAALAAFFIFKGGKPSGNTAAKDHPTEPPAAQAPENDAPKKLAAARQFADANPNDQAQFAERLKEIVKDFPEAPEAVEAKKLLDGLAAKPAQPPVPPEKNLAKNDPPPAKVAPPEAAPPPKPKPPAEPPKVVEETGVPDFEAAAKRVFVFKLEGRSAGNGGYQKTWESIEKSRTEVLKAIYEICGLKLPPNKKVNVLFRDQPGNSKPGQIVYAITYPEGYGSSMHYSIPIVMSRSQNAIHIFQHEMTHALQESIMGNDAYWNPSLLHDWIREGLATYVGGHGPERLVRFKGLGTSLVNGLESHNGPADYAEDYLAFVYMEKTWGRDGVKSFVRDCTYNRVPWKKAIKNLSGMEWPAFTQACKNFSVAYIQGKPTAVAKVDPKPPAATPQPKTDPTTPPPVAKNDPAPPVGKPYFGAQLKDLDEETARTFNLAAGHGVVVLAVRGGSPADSAGIEAGDIVLQFNGRSSSNANQLQNDIAALKPGASVAVQLSREGQEMTFNVTIGTQP